jgi:KRAB domain-containing zinc finger protein
MSRKISEYFKIEPKTTKIDEEVSNLPKIRECRVIVKDIKHQFVNNQLKLFEEVPLNGKNNNNCKYCKKEASTRSNLMKHIIKVHPTEVDLFSCPVCNLKFFKKPFMDLHMKKKHPDGQVKRFECDFDGKTFETKGRLCDHMKSHLSLVKCQICAKVFKPKSLNDHLKTVHATQKNFRCNICSKSFKTAQYLQLHEKTHNKRVQCGICSKMFPSVGVLNQHSKEYHENGKNFECEICSKKFNRKSNLKTHQKTHDRNRPKQFKCQRCDYATDLKDNFKAHQRFHERQDQKFAAMKNPLKCEKCPTFHRDKKFLNLHMKVVHPDVLLQCDLCAKFIKIRSGLVSHMKLHIERISKN